MSAYVDRHCPDVQWTTGGPYHYTIKNTGHGSARYGNCEVCHKPVSEVYYQREVRDFRFEHNGEVHEGHTYEGCRSYFGHEECLMGVRR